VKTDNVFVLRTRFRMGGGHTLISMLPASVYQNLLTLVSVKVFLKYRVHYSLIIVIYCKFLQKRVETLNVGVKKCTSVALNFLCVIN